MLIPGAWSENSIFSIFSLNSEELKACFDEVPIRCDQSKPSFALLVTFGKKLNSAPQCMRLFESRSFPEVYPIGTFPFVFTEFSRAVLLLRLLPFASKICGRATVQTSSVGGDDHIHRWGTKDKQEVMVDAHGIDMEELWLSFSSSPCLYRFHPINMLVIK